MVTVVSGCKDRKGNISGWAETAHPPPLNTSRITITSATIIDARLLRFDDERSNFVVPPVPCPLESTAEGSRKDERVPPASASRVGLFAAISPVRVPVRFNTLVALAPFTAPSVPAATTLLVL